MIIYKKKDNINVLLPPPNITGRLHWGHFLDFTLYKVWIYTRLENNKSITIPFGCDQAGISSFRKIRQKFEQIHKQSFPLKLLKNSLQFNMFYNLQT